MRKAESCCKKDKQNMILSSINEYLHGSAKFLSSVLSHAIFLQTNVPARQFVVIGDLTVTGTSVWWVDESALGLRKRHWRLPKETRGLAHGLILNGLMMLTQFPCLLPCLLLPRTASLYSAKDETWMGHFVLHTVDLSSFVHSRYTTISYLPLM